VAQEKIKSARAQRILVIDFIQTKGRRSPKTNHPTPSAKQSFICEAI
jgi:hypothetical protein